MTQRLSADAVTLRYGERTISQGLSLAIPDGSFTVIVGPNACGKSTLLRALSRLLVPVAGQVILDGRHISQFPAKEVARRLGPSTATSSVPKPVSTPRAAASLSSAAPYLGTWNMLFSGELRVARGF